MKRIIIDCDPGNGIAGANTDDGLALALALASADLTVEMVTTSRLCFQTIHVMLQSGWPNVSVPHRER